MNRLVRIISTRSKYRARSGRECCRRKVPSKKPRHDLEDRFDLLVGQIVDRDDVARYRLGFRHQRVAIGPIERSGKPACALIARISIANVAGAAWRDRGSRPCPGRGTPINTLPVFRHPEVFDQSPPYEDIDLYSSDLPLQEAVRVDRAGDQASELTAFGRQRARPRCSRRPGAPMRTRRSLHLRPERLPPRHRRVPSGLSRLMRASIAAASHASTWTAGTRAAPPAEVARAARYYMAAQVESYISAQSP